MKRYSDIVSDIPSGSVYGICILTFFLADLLTFILAFYLAPVLTFCLVSKTFQQVFILAFYLVYRRDSLWSRSGGERSDP